MDDTITVVPLDTEAWARFRSLWLRCRAERPEQYFDTFAEAAALDESVWRARLRPQRGMASAVFGAERDGELVGTMGVYLATENGRIAYIQHVLIHAGDPRADRETEGRLFGAVAAWAWAYTVDAIIVEVHESLVDLQTYLECGYVATGVRRPSARPEGGQELELRYVVPRV